MTTALLITPEGEIQQVTADNYLAIRDFVGGMIDCATSNELGIVGYVHDEGLLIGLEPNIIASAMFGRPLVGNCLVFGLLNEQGEYDGENHDVPSVYLHSEFQDYAVAVSEDEEVRSMVFGAVAEAIENPITVTTMSDEDFDRWVNGEEG